MVEVGEGLFFDEIDVPATFVGKKIKKLDIRNRYGVDIIMVKKHSPGKASPPLKPGADYTFESNDLLLILGQKEQIDYISKI